jgi:hypothetical protein
VGMASPLRKTISDLAKLSPHCSSLISSPLGSNQAMSARPRPR